MILLAAHDFPYIFPQLAQTMLTWPWLWNAKDHDGLGVNTIGTLWGWPQEVLYGALARLGLSWSVIALLFGVVLVIVVSWYSLGKLLASYKLSKSAITLGRLLFILNTYLLLLVDGGQLNLAVAYGLLPLAIYAIDNALLFATVTLAISFLDFRVVYLVGLLAGIHLLFHFGRLGQYLRVGLVASIIVIGAHAYWLVPAILSRAPALPATYARSAQVGALSFANISHTLQLMQPHWWRNIFGQTEPTRWYFAVIPIVAFLPLVISRRNKVVAFWAVVAAASVFLAKGTNSPFPQAYPWLFQYVPGWSLFRDPTKFFFLVALSYGVLWGFAGDHLCARRKWLYLALVAYLVVVIWPVYLGQMTGLFSRPRHERDYWALAEYLQYQPQGKIVWVSQKPPLGYSDPSHPAVNASTLSMKRPFAVGIVGTYDTLNYLREATYSGELLQAGGVRYLAFAAPDPLRDNQKPEELAYRRLFPFQIQQHPWVESRKDFGEITLLELKDPQPLFYIPRKTEFIIGADNYYQDVTDLAETALIFVDEQPGLLTRFGEFSSAALRVVGGSRLDAAAALVPAASLVFPAQGLDFSPNSTGWWKRETADVISWRSFLEEKYAIANSDFDLGGGWAVAEREKNLGLDLPHCKNRCVLLLRSLESPRGGKIEIYTDELVGSVLTLAKSDQPILGSPMTWTEVGEIGAQDTKVALKTRGDLNVVNALAVVDVQGWADFKSSVATMATRPSVSPAQARVSWVKHNPTSYSVKVTGLEGPATLLFGQNYDSLWRLNGQPAVPVYSWLNGFAVPGDGEYEVRYFGQQYMWPGLVISGLTLVVLIGAWISRRFSKPRP